MHVLLATWDGAGTVPIDFGIAAALVRRGHSLTVLGDPTIAGEAERLGVEFVQWREAPHRRSTALEDDVLKDWECRTPLGLFRRVMTRLVTGPAEAFAAETEEAIRQRHPDVVLVDGALLGPMVGAQALGVPTVGICPGFYILPAPGMPPFGFGLKPAQGVAGRMRDRSINAAVAWAWRAGLAPLNSARASRDLPALSDPWDQLRSCDAVLVTTARAFDFPAQLPDFAHYVGPLLGDPLWADGGEASVEPSHDGPPLVVVGFSGSFVKDQDLVLTRVARALASLPVRGLVCTGPTVDPEQIPGGDNIEVVRAVPHSEVFPRAAVVVNHGGHGTMTKALAAGKPVLCLPKFRDQKDNAVRMTERGAGLSLPYRASERQIAVAVRRLLDEPQFAAAAAALGERIRAEVDESRLVELIERAARAREAA